MSQVENDKYTVLVALVTIIGGFVLMAIGKDSGVSVAISLVIGYYFGKQNRHPNNLVH